MIEVQIVVAAGGRIERDGHHALAGR
jgi:hypothetical protein